MSSSSGGGFPTWIAGGGVSVFLWCFVIFPESPTEKIHISSTRYKSRKDVLKAVTHKMYERLTLKKKKKFFSYDIVSYCSSLVFFFTILLETPPSGPHVPSTLKKRTSPRKLHHIIVNEQSSVAVFPICLGATISKWVLSAAGSLFLRLWSLLMSIFCRRRKKDGEGGRMMVPTDNPRSWMAR